MYLFTFEQVTIEELLDLKAAGYTITIDADEGTVICDC